MYRTRFNYSRFKKLKLLSRCVSSQYVKERFPLRDCSGCPALVVKEYGSEPIVPPHIFGAILSI
jgi:hypothetical protein